MHDLQSSGFKLQLSFIGQLCDFVVCQRISEFTHPFVKLAHSFDVFRRHAGAHQKLAMLLVFEPSRAMPCFPTVHQHFGILCLVAQRARQPAVIFVRVRQHNAAKVRKRDARALQS